jgi:hypothetical protein
MKTTGQKKWFFLAIFAAIVLVFDILGVLHLLSPAYGSGRLQQQVENRILVVISYYESDDVVKKNLNFFFERGMKEDTPSASNVDYVIVVNGNKNSLDVPKLRNVRVVHRENTCYDAGGYAHALGLVNSKSYTHFIFMNGSVRGPFLPTYLRGIHWTWVFTSLITNDVKWAGATINCAMSPHVQTPIVVTDRIGLDVVLKSGSMNCPKNFPDAISNWEVGSSAAILSAGYNIGSLLTRYEKIDFRDPKNHKCNGSKNPAGEGFNDGLGLDPFEVMFVKVKRTVHMGYYAMVGRYSEYALGKRSIQLNAWDDPESQIKIRNVLKIEENMVQRCALIFDTDFYVLMNKDVSSMQQSELLKHYKAYGLSENRLRRYKFAPNTENLKRDDDCNVLVLGNWPHV